MDENEIEKMVEKYLEVSKSKQTFKEKFDKMNILLPNFIYDLINEEFNNIKQIKFSNSIFISLIVNDYYKYVQHLYDIEPLLYEEEKQKYDRIQLPLNIIPETTDIIDEVKKLIATSDRVGVIKNAIEYYIRNNKEIMIRKEMLMDDD